MQIKKLSGLFINCLEAKDSIFESGKMVYDCLLGSEKYSLDYLELTPQNLSLSTEYDFYFFNYHQTKMSWLDTSLIKKLLPGLKITLISEVLPNNPFAYCPPDDFDVYCVLDPTLKLPNENVFAFPRPLEKIGFEPEYQEKEIPVIGSLGFATSGKGFENLIDAVNREFEKALVRINIPFSNNDNKIEKYIRQLAQMCKNKVKKGIEVVVTNDFMNNTDIVKWCRENTLNCFFYDSDQIGLAETTDQAVISGRPLITSKNHTFRHIQSFIKPFPYQTLQEAIKNTKPIVEQIQNEWSTEKFRDKFELVLGQFNFETAVKMNDYCSLRLHSNGQNESSSQELLQKIKEKVAIRTRLTNFKNQGTLHRKVSPKKTPIEFYSQFGEDKIIYELFNDIAIKEISYLDIGANNPKFISNTFLFYELGFQGVLVEPNPYLVGKLRYVRPRDRVINVGIGIDPNMKEADFYMFAEEADGLSTFSLEEAKHWEEVGSNGKKFKIERVLKTPLISINEVIAENFTECPDFISIDVEGWDLKILKTLDFEKYYPAIFCVETLAYKNDGSTYRINEIHEFFESKGYFSFAETYANNIFVNKRLYDFYLYQKNANK